MRRAAHSEAGPDPPELLAAGMQCCHDDRSAVTTAKIVHVVCCSTSAMPAPEQLASRPQLGAHTGATAAPPERAGMLALDELASSRGGSAAAGRLFAGQQARLARTAQVADGRAPQHVPTTCLAGAASTPERGPARKEAHAEALSQSRPPAAATRPLRSGAAAAGGGYGGHGTAPPLGPQRRIRHVRLDRRLQSRPWSGCVTTDGRRQYIAPCWTMEKAARAVDLHLIKLGRAPVNYAWRPAEQLAVGGRGDSRGWVCVGDRVAEEKLGGATLGGTAQACAPPRALRLRFCARATPPAAVFARARAKPDYRTMHRRVALHVLAAGVDGELQSPLASLAPSSTGCAAELSSDEDDNYLNSIISADDMALFDDDAEALVEFGVVGQADELLRGFSACIGNDAPACLPSLPDDDNGTGATAASTSAKSSSSFAWLLCHETEC